MSSICNYISKLQYICKKPNFLLFLIVTEYLKVRSHDPEEAIRHDVIVTIITAGKRDLSLVNDQLLGFVRERTLDKRVSVNTLFSRMSLPLMSLIKIKTNRKTLQK